MCNNDSAFRERMHGKEFAGTMFGSVLHSRSKAVLWRAATQASRVQTARSSFIVFLLAEMHAKCIRIVKKPEARAENLQTVSREAPQRWRWLSIWQRRQQQHRRQQMRSVRHEKLQDDTRGRPFRNITSGAESADFFRSVHC